MPLVGNDAVGQLVVNAPATGTPQTSDEKRALFPVGVYQSAQPPTAQEQRLAANRANARLIRLYEK